MQKSRPTFAVIKLKHYKMLQLTVVANLEAFSQVCGSRQSEEKEVGRLGSSIFLLKLAKHCQDAILTILANFSKNIDDPTSFCMASHEELYTALSRKRKRFAKIPTNRNNFCIVCLCSPFHSHLVILSQL